MTDVEMSLTRTSLDKAVTELAQLDPLIAGLVGQYGNPPLWQRPQSFRTLVHVVLEQKVSLASARAVMLRVQELCPDMNPASFLQVSEPLLRKAGISERKVSYCRSIALAITTDALNLTRLRHDTDSQVMEQLIAVRGIGPGPRVCTC